MISILSQTTQAVPARMQVVIVCILVYVNELFLIICFGIKSDKTQIAVWEFCLISPNWESSLSFQSRCCTPWVDVKQTWCYPTLISISSRYVWRAHPMRAARRLISLPSVCIAAVSWLTWSDLHKTDTYHFLSWSKWPMSPEISIFYRYSFNSRYTSVTAEY